MEKSKILKHELLITFSLPNDKYLFLTETTKEGNDCKLCVAKMSIFTIKKLNKDWIIESKSLNHEGVGEFGNLDIPKLKKIGKNTFGLIYELECSSGGVLAKSLIIKALDNSNIDDLLTIYFYDMSSSEDEDTFWRSEYSFIDNGRRYYDIVIKIKGSRDLEKFEEKKVFKLTNSTFDFYNYYNK